MVMSLEEPWSLRLKVKRTNSDQKGYVRSRSRKETQLLMLTWKICLADQI